MAFLLDTHVFLWFIAGDDQLPKTIKKKLEDINQSCFISIASFWGIVIKKQIGKLDLGIALDELFAFAKRNQIEIIPVSEKHLSTLLTLDLFHNDPLDRLIISQAISEKLTLLTRDKKLKQYKVKQQWE